MPGRQYLAIAVLTGTGLAGTGLAGCGFTAVDAEPHELTPGSAAACAALDGALPDTVSDAVRRDVRDSPDGVVAWGEPPVVLRCGTGLPPEYEPDAVLTELNGVAWLPIEGVGGDFFATVDREPIVEVAVPDDYDPAVVLGDLAPSILAEIPERALE